jgi:AraC-like DNA-binding protein
MTIESSDNRPSLKTLAKISDIAKMISRRPAHRFAVSAMAAHAKMSESYFTALFRSVIGLPPYAYLSKCRLDTARARLAETDASVAAIAHDLGFSSPQHLAMQFRKTFGLTPTEWRRQPLS